MAKEEQVFLGQRIAKKLMRLIDQERGAKSRSQWTREAFVEKLIREHPEQAADLLSLINAPDRQGVGGRPSHKKKLVINEPSLPSQSENQACAIPDEVKRGVIGNDLKKGFDLESG